MHTHRGHRMLQISRAKKSAKPDPAITYFCFKCKFFSTSQKLFDNHMTYLHLVPPQSVNGKFLALSNASLLHCTFLPASGVQEEEEEEEEISSNEKVGSEISGVGRISNDENDHVVHNEIHAGMYSYSPSINDEVSPPDVPDGPGLLDDAFMATPGPSKRNEEIHFDTEMALSTAGSVNNSEDRIGNQRFTSSGGIRNTPTRNAQKRTGAAKRNLIPGANKKASNVGDIGDFKTKYRATEKTKKVVVKLGKESAMNLLKLNNSRVDGLDNEKNGFFIMYKVGGKFFTASEGIAGREFIEEILLLQSPKA